MTQAYSNPERENDLHALPNVETFYVNSRGFRIDGVPFALPHELGEEAYGVSAGWYWQPCFPGCLPDGDPVGPFDTEQEALEDAQEGDD